MARKKKDVTFVPSDPDDDRPKKVAAEESQWAGRLKRAKDFQRKYSGGWDDNRRLIFNEAQGMKTGVPWIGTSTNQVAYGWGLYEGLQTEIYVQNPDIIISARDQARRPIAKRVQSALTYDLEQMDAKDIGNLCLLDTFICGYGAVIESVENEHEKDEDGKRTGKLSWQDFQLRRIEPRDVLFDPNSRKLDLSDCRYLFVAWYPTIEQLRNDEYITDLPDDIEDFPESSEFTRTVGNADAASGDHQATHGTGQGEKDPAYKTICVWEVYDKVGRELIYITDKDGLIIGRAPWPVNLRFGALDMFPVTLLFAHPVPGRFYPRPEAELIAPQLRELNVIDRLISEDSTTKFRKWITLGGILTDEQKSKITDTSLANALLYVDAAQLADVLGLPSSTQLAGLDLRNLVVPIEDIAPKKDLPGRYQMLEAQIQQITGYGPSQRGGLPSTRSAREAMMINAKQEARLGNRRDQINRFYQRLSMKHVRFLQKYMVTERYAKVMPKLGQLSEWVKYSGEDIQGDFEFEVVAGTTTPKNTEVKKAATLQMVQAVIPALQQAGQSIRPAVELLAEVNGWDDVDLCFSNVKEKARMAVRVLSGFSKGEVPPEQLLDVFSGLLMAELTPAEFQMEAEAIKKGQPMLPGAHGGGPPQEAAGQRGDPNPQATAQGVP